MDEDYTPSDEFEFGFYDSETPPERYTNAIFWFCFGLPFQSIAMAEHTGSKSCYGQPVIVRRPIGERDPKTYEVVLRIEVES